MIIRRDRELVLWLALLLGYANPDAMLEEMDARHILEWSEFLRTRAKVVFGMRF